MNGYSLAGMYGRRGGLRLKQAEAARRYGEALGVNLKWAWVDDRKYLP